MDLTKDFYGKIDESLFDEIKENSIVQIKVFILEKDVHLLDTEYLRQLVLNKKVLLLRPIVPNIIKSVRKDIDIKNEESLDISKIISSFIEKTYPSKNKKRIKARIEKVFEKVNLEKVNLNDN